MITLRYPYYMSALPLAAVMPVLLKDDLLWMAEQFENQGDRFSDLKVQSVAVQSCFINVCCQLLGT